MDSLNSINKKDDLHTHVERLGKRKWIRVVLIMGIIYCFDVIIFGKIAGWSKSPIMVTIWRLASWLTSALFFTIHIWYEHYRLSNPPRKTALHTSLAAALGAFGLAVAANLHGQFVSSANQLLLLLSLVIWPLLTVVPAFIVAFAITFFLQYFRKRV